jgi:hypothetical protein
VIREVTKRVIECDICHTQRDYDPLRGVPDNWFSLQWYVETLGRPGMVQNHFCSARCVIEYMVRNHGDEDEEE